MKARRALIALALFLCGLLAGGATVWVYRDALEEVKPERDVGPARVWEATVYLPLADNQGRPFAEADWHAALDILVKRFKGATLGEPREGRWLDQNNQVQRERIRPVTISFEPSRLEEFRAAVREAGRRLGQEAMYVRFEEPRVELIPVTPE